MHRSLTRRSALAAARRGASGRDCLAGGRPAAAGRPRPLPGVLAAHNVSRWGVVAFALVVLLGPALILFGIEAVVALADRRAGYVVHLVWVGALSALLALTFVRRLGWAPAPTFAVSVALGALFAAAYARLEAVRSGCSVLGLAPVVIGVLFLFTSKASSLVTAGEPRLWNARAASAAPVVVVVLDALPVQLLMDDQSRINRRRFPSFARFARGATWYPNATTVHENTVFAVPAILDGKVPEGGQEPTVQDHPENLFTLLGNSYDMRVSEEATNMCPARLCERPNDRGATARLTLLADDASVVYGYLVAPDALRDRLPPINDRWRNFRDSPDTRRGQAVARNQVIARLVGGERPQRFQTSIDAIRPGRRPTLDFMHVLLPHEPLEYLPSRPALPGRCRLGPLRDALLRQRIPDRPGPAAPPAAGGLRRSAARPVDRAIAPHRVVGPRDGGRRRRPRHLLPRQANPRTTVRRGQTRLPP